MRQARGVGWSISIVVKKLTLIFIGPESDHCTMRLPMSIDISEVLKCKHSFHAHFK